MTDDSKVDVTLTKGQCIDKKRSLLPRSATAQKQFFNLIDKSIIFLRDGVSVGNVKN